ncbi:Glycine betaine methyltransferase [Nymphon striatum]|nr:Glycine betaine methyltransferase [Nymphon striatum]
MKGEGWEVQITSPTESVTSMNGVTIDAQQSLEYCEEANVVLFGSGIYTRDIAKDNSILDRIKLKTEKQLVGSQCSGALLMAKLGLLNGLPASGLLNIFTILTQPELFNHYADKAVLDIYRSFISGYFSQHIQLIVSSIGLGQIIVALLLSAGGRWVQLGVFGGAQHLLSGYSLLDNEALSLLEKNTDYILENIGIDLHDDPISLETLKPLGASVDGIRVRHAKDVTIGGGKQIFAPVYGPPEVHRSVDGKYTKQLGTLSDYREMVSMCDSADTLQTTGFMLCYVHDIPEEERHLAMAKAHLELSDKPFMGTVISEDALHDVIELVGRGTDKGECNLLHLINSSPPLRYQQNALKCLRAASLAGEGSIVTVLFHDGCDESCDISSLSQIKTFLCVLNRPILYFFFMTLLSTNVTADVVKWVDAEGNTHYSNKEKNLSRNNAKTFKFVEYKSASNNEQEEVIQVNKNNSDKWQEAILVCMKMKQSMTTRTRDYCESINDNYGDGGMNSRGFYIQRMFHDIPECREAYKAWDRRSRKMRGYPEIEEENIMKIKSVLIASTIAGVMGLASLTANAESEKSVSANGYDVKGESCKKGGGHRGHRKGFKKMFAQLDLTDAQKTQIKELRQQKRDG